MISDKVQWRPVLLVYLLFIINGLGYFISLAPQTQLFENIVCRHVFQNEHAGVPDKCKSPAVQEVVAKLFGYQALFDGIPGLLLAMPYGVLADKIGRKFILMLSMIGQAASAAWIVFVCWTDLPVQWIWLSSAFTIIGGGSTVAAAVCMMVITDAVPEHLRSRLLFGLSAAFIIAEIVGPFIGSMLMAHDLWTPVMIGTATSLFTAFLSALIPETLEETRPPRTLLETSPLKTVRDLLAHSVNTFSFIFSTSNVAFLVFSFLVVDFSRQSTSILLQYVSERFGWSLAQAGYLRSFRAVGQLVFIALILPTIDAFATARMDSQEKDLLLAKCSLALLTASFAALSFAPGVGIVILGLVLGTLSTGVNTFTQSLASSLVEPSMIGTLYTALSVMETTGSLLAGPLIAESFKWAMKIGGIWHGLPFMLSLGLCGFATILLTRVRVDGAAIKDGEDDEAKLLGSDTDMVDERPRIEIY